MEVGKKRANNKLALVYDFDGTLIDEEMIDPILEDLGLNVKKFWKKSNRFAKDHSMDRICCYMHLLLKEAKAKDFPITEPYLRKIGRRLKMRSGLTGSQGWFSQVKDVCRKHGLRPEHYVVTSGLAEIVKASPISKHIKKVFGSSFHYERGKAVWPAQVVNYTTKTQYLFRINKGALDVRDEKAPNEYMDDDERPVPFERMVFIGDGETDIPCFSLVKRRDGTAIALLRKKDSKKNWQLIEQLIAGARVDRVSLTAHFEEKGILIESIRRTAKRLGRK